MTEEEIYAMEEVRRQAMTQGDLLAMESIFADDMVWIHASSKVDGKSSMIEGYRSKRLQCLSLNDSDVKVRIYNDIAIVSGVTEMDVCIDNNSRKGHNRFTAIYMFINEQKKLVSWQSTRLASKS
ncbi:MAG: nuclear transport factor 2 family protein [Emcibacter sp.]|nr:nuclear transport factor 2 family protein [Emcibacter sp.]